MNKYSRLLLCTAFTLLSGCANHIRDIVVKDTKIERINEKEDYFVKFADKDRVIENPELNISVEKQSWNKVVHYEITHTKQVFTPYEGWRESYEIPLGIGLFPCALVVSLTDFATLGFIPNRFTDDLLDYSFAGMNPCLNIENEDRAVFKHSPLEKKKIDSRREIVKTPGADMEIQLYSVDGKKPLLVTKTSAGGIAEISLFHDKLLNSDLRSQREFAVVLIDRKAKELARNKVLISRYLAIRLKKAVKAIADFRTNETPENLAETIWKLEKLRFPKAAFDLEKKTLAAHKKDKTFAKRLKAAMDKMNP